MSTEYPGVVGRSLTDIIGETISVLAYGAVGDGVTDDGPAFVKALTRLTILNGRRLYVPGGRTYMIKTPVVFPAGDLRILFEGDGDSTIIKRGDNMPAGQGVFDLTGVQGVQFGHFTFDGDVTTPTPQTYTSISNDPMHALLTTNTSFWLKAGCSDIVFNNVYITHTGGYAALLDARSGNISDVRFDGCYFENNRPHRFGVTASQEDYGSWTGGIFYEGDGSTYAVENLTVSNCDFKRMTGNCIWGHLYALNKLHKNVTVVDSRFTDIGRDGVLIGGVVGGVVSRNRFRRIGYMTLSDVDTPVPKYLVNHWAVAIDTSGVSRGVNYTDNYIMSANGGCLDLDGYAEGIVSGNTCIVPSSGDPEYTDDSVASYGTSGVNITYGVNVGNTNGTSLGATKVSVEQNKFINMGAGAVRMYASRGGSVKGNTIDHSATAPIAPIILGNIGTGANQRAYNNVVTKNVISYNPASPIGAIQEDDSLGAFDPSDTNYVYDNTLIGSNTFELYKNAATQSTTKQVLSSAKPVLTQASETVVQREDLYTRWYTKIGNVSTVALTMHDQVTLAGGALGGTLLNVSRGAGVGGVVSTAGRTTSAFDDAVLSGKLYADGFIALARATYSDVQADLLSDAVWLLRYNTTTHQPEHSYSTSGGARVWSPFVSTATADGVAGSVQFAGPSSDFASDTEFFWDDTQKALRIGAVMQADAKLQVNGPSYFGGGSNDFICLFRSADNLLNIQTILDGQSLASYTSSPYGGTQNFLRLQPLVGRVSIGPGSYGGTLDVAGNQFLVSQLSGSIVLLIQGSVGQTANLTEWRNSAGTALCAVDSLGNVYSPAIALRTDAVNPSSTTEGKYGAREVRFRQTVGHETNAGVISYGLLGSALSLVGFGTAVGNRAVSINDLVTISGSAGGASLSIASGFINSTEGFYSAGSAANTLNLPNGGATAVSFVSVRNDGANGLTLSRVSGTARQYGLKIDSSGHLRIADDTAAFTRMSITTSGNVGIGDSSVAKGKLSVFGSNGYAYTGHNIQVVARLFGDANHAVLLGTANAANSSGYTRGLYWSYATDDLGIVRYKDDDTGYLIDMYINTGGSVLVGTNVDDGSGGRFQVTGFVSASTGFYSASSATDAFKSPTGGITARFLIGTRSLTLAGDTAANAGLSASGQGRLYFDSGSNKFRISENGGAYIDLIGASGGLTGLTAGRIPYTTGATGIADTPNLLWDNSTKVLTITGTTTTAGLVLASCYVQSAEGYYSPASPYNAVNIPNGGVYVRSGHFEKYIHIAGNSGVPSATSGTSIPNNGTIYYDTSSGKFRGYENGSWKDMIGVLTVNGTTYEVSVSTSGNTVTVGLPDQVVVTGFSAGSAGITLSSGYIDSSNGFYSAVSSDEAVKLINGGITCREVSIYNSGGGGAYTTVVNGAGQFVGNGVSVQAYGVGGAGFSVWNSGTSSYYTGQTQTSMQIVTDVRDNVGTVEKKTRTLDIRGGVVTSISAESGWTPI